MDLPGFTHEDVNKRIGDPTDDVLTPALQAFLTECLAALEVGGLLRWPGPRDSSIGLIKPT